jgi:hypothetical protein
LDLIPEVVAVGWNDAARSGGVELASIKIWYEMCVTTDGCQRDNAKRFTHFPRNKHFGKPGAHVDIQVGIQRPPGLVVSNNGKLEVLVGNKVQQLGRIVHVFMLSLNEVISNSKNQVAAMVD